MIVYVNRVAVSHCLTPSIFLERISLNRPFHYLFKSSVYMSRESGD
jgi:hypothetical protein